MPLLRLLRMPLLLIIMLGASTELPAKSTDRQQPINVEQAQTFDGFNAPNSVNTFTGNVLATQGTLQVTGNIAKLYTDADQNIKRVVVYGTPSKLAHIQQLDDNDKLMTGDADKLDYDLTTNLVVLTGHAHVTHQGRGEGRGDQLVYNTESGNMNGHSDNGRVHMIFLPKAPAPAPTSASAPAPAAAAGVKP